MNIQPLHKRPTTNYANLDAQEVMEQKTVAVATGHRAEEQRTLDLNSRPKPEYFNPQPGSAGVDFFFVALEPRVELYKSLSALNTSPPRNRRR